uniref:Uncharacterized protein n=1 Tax=Peromyscus maniculatus bairdii TaxID=230844 RepID=A0A8C8UPZ7_PERMB
MVPSSDLQTYMQLRKRESPALFHPNVVEARHRSVGPPRLCSNWNFTCNFLNVFF